MGVPFPSLPVPLPTTKGTVLRAEDVQAVLRCRERTVLVVSHCCATSDSYLAVAPIAPKKPKDEREERALLAAEPSRPNTVRGDDHAGGEYGFDLAHFRLEPVSGVLDAADPAHQVAQLTRIISFTGGCSSLVGSRAARLDPRGRRLLRIKLSLFWGRPEMEDKAFLEANGIPVGLAP